MNLPNLIATIRSHIEQSGMSSGNVRAATVELLRLGYEYNYKTFPKLTNTNEYSLPSNETPSNLAEALLWKLGKWNSYKKICSQYDTGTPAPTKTDVVFYAFAQHLRDNDKPIYDQHTLRALWAVNSNLISGEINKIRNSLLNKSGKWKQTMNGKYTVDCYNIYCSRLNEIIKDGASLKEIDHLLMPLGQAIKKSTESYSDFLKLTGQTIGFK